jgi:energy-converting hydrogenase Eha subunit F
MTTGPSNDPMRDYTPGLTLFLAAALVLIGFVIWSWI